MLPVCVASGIMVLAGLCAGYVGAKNLRIDRTFDQGKEKKLAILHAVVVGALVFWWSRSVKPKRRV